jgi:TonB family protein
MNQVQYCYRRELTKTPGLSGEMTVDFIVGPGGAVQSAKMASTSLNNARVEQCVLGRFMRMQFPPVGVSSSVSYPFEFEPV